MKKLILAVCALAVLLALPGIAVAAPSGGPDHDGVDNRNERRQGTDPHRRDSDRDGRADGREDADHDGLDNATEDATGNDPVDRDSDDDGTRDDREGAGTVTSFADDTLTIRLAGGSSVSAAVDERTDLSCPTESGYERAQAGRRASKGLRRGSRDKAGRRSSRRSVARAHRSVVPDDDGDWGDDEEGDDPSGDGDEDWSDDPSDDGWDDDDSDADEDWGDDETEEPSGACLALLARGTRVHASTLEPDEDGAYFVTVELVR